MIKDSQDITCVFIDFGLRKPHTILIGGSDRVLKVSDLGDLNLENCSIFIEEGYSKNELYKVSERNRIFTVSGRLVKELRESQGISKSDQNDVFVLRQLVSSSPDLFREMSREDKQELHDKMTYSYYCKLTSLVSALRNKQTAFAKEFGRNLPQLDTVLDELEREKGRLLKYFNKFEACQRTLAIHGVGVRYLGGILISADPSKFRSLSAYLRYCGLKASARRTWWYNKHVRSLYYQVSVSVVMKKDEHFYPLYLKIKADLSQRFPGYPKFRVDLMARNRLATFIAKRIYSEFNGAKAGGIYSGGAQSRSSSALARNVPRDQPV